MLEVPDWGLASWSWFGYGHWSLIYLWSKFWLFILILKLQRTSMYFNSWFGALEDAGDSWLGFGILILIWIWSLVFGTTPHQAILDHIQIKIWIPSPSQEPPASSKAPNWDLKDIDVLCTFKNKIKSPNSDHGCITDLWPYPNQDQDVKPQSGTFSFL